MRNTFYTKFLESPRNFFSLIRSTLYLRRRLDVIIFTTRSIVGVDKDGMVHVTMLMPIESRLREHMERFAQEFYLHHPEILLDETKTQGIDFRQNKSLEDIPVYNHIQGT